MPLGGPSGGYHGSHVLVVASPGSREVYIDGKDVPGSQGTNTALGGPATVTFEVCGDDSGVCGSDAHLSTYPTPRMHLPQPQPAPFPTNAHTTHDIKLAV